MPGGNHKNEVADPVTGLFPSQKQAILESWNIVLENGGENGIEFFIRYLLF